MQLVNELKDLLKEKQYSIANAAKAMDISSTTLHLWMNKKYKAKNILHMTKTKNQTTKIFL